MADHTLSGRSDAILRRRDNRRQQQPDRGGNLGGASGILRVDALVQYGDHTWLRRRWVDPGGAGSGALPWNVLRIEPPRIVTDERG